MMKIASRLFLALLIGCYAGLEIWPNFFLENKLFGALFISLTGLSAIFLFFFLLIWLIRSEFQNPAWKIVWIFVMFFLYYFIGPILVYLLVYEFKLTIKLKIKN